jgi:hypothetical protein
MTCPRTNLILLSLVVSLGTCLVATAAEIRTQKTFEISGLDSNGPPLTIDLPADFVLKEVEGPDFTVYYLKPSSEKSAESNAFVTIYVGWAPGLFTQNGPSMAPDIVVKTERHTTAGQDVEWFCWEEKSDAHVQKREALLKGLFRGMRSDQGTDWGGLILHVIIGSDDSATLERLQASVDRLKIRPK